MAFNVFNKVYVAPDFAYDSAFNRAIFSAHRNQAEYVTYDALNSPGFNSEVLVSKASINDIIGSDEGQYASIAHYLKSLFDSGIEARLYCDGNSYMPLFFTWLKISFPNISSDISFTLYNLIKQRESLVFPDNADNRTFTSHRIQYKDLNPTLTKAEFLSAYNEFNSNDTVSAEYYEEVRNAVRDSLCTEVQLASYLAGDISIDSISVKIKRILTKIVFANVDSLREYIRDNIMTAKVRNMSGVNLSWDDQDWEGALRNSSANMNFLFDSSLDAIMESSEYRDTFIDTAIEWNEWVLANTTESDLDDLELNDIIKGAQFIIKYKDAASDDDALRNAALPIAIQFDIDFEGSTVIFQTEYLRDKINTFWIEYIYQLKKSNDIDGLKLISHT